MSPSALTRTLATVAALLTVAVAVVAALLLTRGPSEKPAQPDATSTSVDVSPAPTAPTPPPSPGAVTVSTSGFSITDADGADVFVYRWRDDAAAAVDALTELFGSAPKVSATEGDDTHLADFTTYSWNGFQLAEMVETADGLPRDQYAVPSYVEASVNSLDAATISLPDGISVGMSIDAARQLAAEGGFTSEQGSLTCTYAPTTAVDGLAVRAVMCTTEGGTTVTTVRYGPFLDM